MRIERIKVNFTLQIKCVFTFTRLDDDSISKVCFVETAKYRWDERCDVQKYSLSCTADGTLSFRITMKDGEVVDLWGSVNSCSEAFTEKYGDLYGYAAHLSNQFDSGEFIIEKSVSGVDHMESFYRESYPDIWENLQKIID